MKIRTGFVTNSSSYASANIVIDNPLLLEILQKYKEMGVFEDAEIEFEIGTGDEEQTQAPAFIYQADNITDASDIQGITEVVSNIIEIMDYANEDGDFDKDLYEQMKNELLEREEEINLRFIDVKWNVGESSNETEDGQKYGGQVWFNKNYKFNYKIGEEYHYCKEYGGGVLAETHWKRKINEKEVEWIKDFDKEEE